MPRSTFDALRVPEANIVTAADARSAQTRRVISPVMAVPLAVVGGLAAVVTAAIALVVAGGEAATGVDRWAHAAVAAAVPDPGNGAYAIDFLGDPRMILGGAAVVMVACLVVGRRRCAIVAMLAPAATGIVTTVAKQAVGRTIHGPDNLAFPSGHTAAMTSLAAVALLLLVGIAGSGRAAGTAVFVAGSVVIGSIMAVDQIAIDAHYPTDTVGGLCTAVAVVVAVAFAVDAGADALSSRRSRR